MRPKKTRAPSSRTFLTFSAAAAATALLLAAACSSSSSPSTPILGVEAFSVSSRLPPSNYQRLPIYSDRHASSSSRQRISTSVLYAAAAAKDDDDQRKSKSDDDGSAPAPAPAAAEDEVSRQLSKAKELIERTKQKMESKEKAAAAAAAAAESDEDDADQQTESTTADEDEVLPFFAVDPTAAEKRREMVTKTKDEESGLITTDGDKMASLAEGETWESRGLYDLFENEIEEDAETLAKEARASRDVARSMMNLKMIMNKADFDFIFDKKNRFIGEE